MSIKDSYKDRLFGFIFGNEENREWTLSLYNAINGSDYKNPEEIKINTIREVLYLGMHNDVSFIIGDNMNLYEQQSSYNPNMPLRMLQYAGNLYERYVKENKLNKYGEKILELPIPKLVVFYNGRREAEDEVILQLSDSFPEGTEPDIEVRVRMLNINYGRNKELLEACRPLQEYSWLIQTVRDYKQETGEIETAVNNAINDMPGEYVLKAFLESHRAEVKGMLLTEYNEVETMELFKRDAREEGLREGRKEGIKEGRKEGIKEGIREGIKESIQSLMETLHLTMEQAMDALKIPQGERNKYML